ncbi:bacteriorhodopsin [Parvularcula maris]|uniref:Bacteriorhodopsin-like n=1 Tax=Parvularcula maris TaxID=2965077 RepID=A0A9X2RH94_9PROT|nr:bacteriorhodopsin [Parvularcula maris]MCQ8184634.1 bacteriorhodopsin-like [Parvularcula maris]
MPNIENYLTFEHWHFDYVRHIFTLTVAVFGAGLVYFLLSARNVAPRYRASSYLSAVVMVSATYEIFSLWLGWDSSFAYNGSEWALVEGKVFSNGYRYANWCIDVPMLLTQLLIVAGFAGQKFWSNWWQFTAAGLLMIFTGYIGQYYEPQVAGLEDGSTMPFWIWGLVSSVFYAWIVYLTIKVTLNPHGDMPVRARKELRNVGILLIVSWTLYPFAYGWPAWQPDADGVVVRQTLYTLADIFSKLVYGVMLGRVALMRSAYEGFPSAIEVGGDQALTSDERKRITA